jgi:diguanylate cyclase (GGDEF)-like protein
MPLCSSESVHAPLERLRSRIAANPIVVDGTPVPVTVSIGVATYAGPARDANESAVMQRADEALYAAKREGRDRLVSADSR